MICAWRNRWVGNREAGDLRRHCAHYDVNVMHRHTHDRPVIPSYDKAVHYCLVDLLDRDAFLCLWYISNDIQEIFTYGRLVGDKLSIPNDSCSLQWHKNGRDSVSNHQPHDCLLNRLFRRRSKKTSKLCVTGLCVGNSPGTGEFPAQRVSNAENGSIWWRHHVFIYPHSSVASPVRWNTIVGSLF